MISSSCGYPDAQILFQSRKYGDVWRHYVNVKKYFPIPPNQNRRDFHFNGAIVIANYL